MPKAGSQQVQSPSLMMDERIKELGDWRGAVMSWLRTLIKQADPNVVEEWKWRGVPVWSHDFREDDKIDEKALKALIQEAVALNASRVKKR